jgi:uncharacterized protein YjbI with pentapeptide repeats
MMSVVLVFAVFFILMLLAVFFWFWWVGPRDQVPPHLTEQELRRLEVQDRIRQTNYQVLTALALGATFLTTLFQFLISSQHWTTEFESKANQERTSQFIEAVRQLDQGSQPPKTEAGGAASTSDVSATSIAGMRTLYLLGMQRPSEYHGQAHNLLSAYVVSKTRGKSVLADSRECRNDFGMSPAAFGELLNYEKDHNIREEREEGLPAVQAAMASLGDRKFSKFRVHDEGTGCKSRAGTYKLTLEHVTLDNLDLSGMELSCALMSQAKLRRVSFKGANLASADLRGARLADYDIPNSPAATGAIRDRLYAAEAASGPPEWKPHRCWVTDLRGANLAHANFEGAALGGADLTDADLTGANLCRTDISRANFTRVKGLSLEVLRDACAGRPDSDETVHKEAQPVGLKAEFYPIKRCSRYSCASEASLEVSNEALSGQLRTNFKADIASALAVAVAWAVFFLVGAFAKSKLQVRLQNSSVEIPSRFPERSVTYSSEFLKAFVRDYPSVAQYYRVPILFPLDLIVMLLLSAAMAAASWHWFAASGFRWPMISAILPLLYFVADLAEDLRLRRLLNNPDAVTRNAVASFKILTVLKMATIIAVVIQTLAALSVYIWFLGIPIF